jgi:hypothetical protein
MLNIKYLMHGQMNYKDTEPYMSAFLLNGPVNGPCGMCLTDFRDWIRSLMVGRDTVSHIGIFDPSCVMLPLYLLSDLPALPPFPK